MQHIEPDVLDQVTGGFGFGPFNLNVTIAPGGAVNHGNNYGSGSIDVNSPPAPATGGAPQCQ